jgi:hypothetical protein
VVSYYTVSNACLKWQGLQSITDYKKEDPTLPLYQTKSMHLMLGVSAVTDPDYLVISLFEAEMKKIFKSGQPKQGRGAVLRGYAEQLQNNLSLSQSVIPYMFKMTIIIPVPKNSKASCHNDYCPVALTSVIMKCFERLVMAHINSIIPDTLDPLQFAYRPNRSIDDAISIAIHTALTYLDKRNLSESAVHGLQLSVQHHFPFKAHHQVSV